MAPQDVQCAADNHDGIELVDINPNAFSGLPMHFVNNESDRMHPEEGHVINFKGKGKDEGTGRGSGKKGSGHKVKDEGKASSSSSSTTKEQQPAENASDTDDTTHQRPAHIADSNHLLTEDTRFEHRQYLQKQLRRLQREACRRHTCKAYIPSRCRVHSHLFRDLDDFLALRAHHDLASGSFYRSIEHMFKDGESTETCATLDAPSTGEKVSEFTEYEKGIMKRAELIDKFFVAFMLFCLFVTLVPKLEALLFKR